MRKKINQRIICLLLIVQVLTNVVQADIVTGATKSTTKAVVTTQPMVSTKAATKNGDKNDETKTTFESCSASSSSEGECLKWKRLELIHSKPIRTLLLSVQVKNYIS